MTYTERFIFRLTPLERKALDAVAAQASCTKSDFIRTALMNDVKFVQSSRALQETNITRFSNWMPR